MTALKSLSNKKKRREKSRRLKFFAFVQKNGGICTASGGLKKFVTALKPLTNKKASGEISTLEFFEFVAAFKRAVGHLYSQRRIEKI
ncbi:MAG: hypothetical protein IJT47_05590, partial [Selenomonadaceae bacterium]|nr:hypothetical protein [Selenomonadaceae bacterium]